MVGNFKQFPYLMNISIGIQIRQAPLFCYSLQGKEKKKKKPGASQHFSNDKSEGRRILKYHFLMLLRSLRYICEYIFLSKVGPTCSNSCHIAQWWYFFLSFVDKLGSILINLGGPGSCSYNVGSL
jgi:hypothetical protein